MYSSYILIHVNSIYIYIYMSYMYSLLDDSHERTEQLPLDQAFQPATTSFSALRDLSVQHLHHVSGLHRDARRGAAEHH